MMNSKTADYDYILPEELIAQNPVKRRDQSRLLVLDKESGCMQHKVFFQLLECLKPKDLVVMNDSKVFPARIFGVKDNTGGKIEVLLHKQIDCYTWEIIGKGLRNCSEITFSGGKLKGKIVGRKEEFYNIEFNMSSIELFDELERCGEVPLPPYIHRGAKFNKDNNDNDKLRYQTVYAKNKGSVAAPTAGLHFTEALLNQINKLTSGVEYLTLHVGIGTFAPVKTDLISEHKMHQEYYSISKHLIKKISETKENGGRIIAIGTTTTRVLESLYRNGEPKIENNHSDTIKGFTDIFIYLCGTAALFS